MKFKNTLAITTVLAVSGILAIMGMKFFLETITQQPLPEFYTGPGMIVGAALLAFATGVVMIIYSYFQRMRWQVIKDTPTSKIRSLAVGRVELQGIIQKAQTALQMPFQNVECVSYEIQIQECRNEGEGTPVWVTLKTITNRVPFYLKDKTGKIFVLPEKAEIQPSHYCKLKIRGPGNEPANAFLKEHGISVKGILGQNKKLRVMFKGLFPGRPVYIMGYAGIQTSDAVHSIAVQFKQGEPFLISTRLEDRERARHSLWLAMAVTGIAVMVGSWIAVLPLTEILNWTYSPWIAAGATILIIVSLGWLRLQAAEKTGRLEV